MVARVSNTSMTMPESDTFWSSTERWLKNEQAILSAVVFGSTANRTATSASADKWSDVDLHVITKSPLDLERVDWSRAMSPHRLCLQVVKPATGGVRKVTAIFSTGQIDLVLVPAKAMTMARFAMRLGLHRRHRKFQVALNEMATTLRAGYRFVKGERSWGSFYTRVATEMVGVRLSNRDAVELADVFLCDLLWVLQKIERGELMAAQLVMHRSLGETNFRLVRESRLRNAQPLPSFGLGRHLERLLPAEELSRVQIDAHLDVDELRAAAWRALSGLRANMNALAPVWAPSAPMIDLLRQFNHCPNDCGEVKPVR